MAKEIERKFLVTGHRWRLQADAGVEIRQAYLMTMNDRSLRVRTYADKRAKLTMKVGHSALVRDEYEVDVGIAEAREMMSHAVGTVIEKVRHKVRHDGFTWEIDVYGGAYSGLVVAEVELSSVDEKPALPDWIGREVTGEARYSNQAMALAVPFPGRPHAIQHQA